MKHLYFYILLFLPFQLFGFDFQSVTAEYEVSYGVIGTVGKAEATIEINKGTYKIRIKVQGTGLADFFSRGRVEVYESTGIVQDGKLLPTLFVKNRAWGKKEERKRYFFNHDKKIVTVVSTKVNGGKVSEDREAIPFYAKDDILTLFFNLESLIGKTLQPNEKINLIAVGASHDSGEVSVEAPKDKKREEIKKLLAKDKHLLIVILHQKLFASKDGEFYLNISDDGICDRVILKDVLMYGDLVGKIKNLKINK